MEFHAVSNFAPAGTALNERLTTAHAISACVCEVTWRKTMLHSMHLYPQPTRHQPSVEYVPLPYRSRRNDSRDSV